MADTTYASNGTIRPSVKEMGTSGLRVIGGHLDEEFEDAWRQYRKARTIREMITDPMVSRSLWTFELLIRNVKWDVEPADESNEAMLAKDFVHQVLFEDQSHSWSDALSNHLTMLSFGWAYHELVWKRRLGYRSVEPGLNSKFNDGRWGLRKTAFRAQDTLWEWSKDPKTQEFDGMVQMDSYAHPSRGTVKLPLEECLLFRLSNYNSSPEGRSLLRSAYVPWYHKKHTLTFQGIGIEHDLVGIPLIRVPANIMSPSASDDEVRVRNQFERMGANIRKDEQAFVMLPSVRDDHGEYLYDFSLMSLPGSGARIDTKPIIDAHNQEIVTALMTDVVLVGHESVGSHALHSSVTSLLSFGLGGVMDSIAEVYTRHFLPRLWAANGLHPDTMPKGVVHGDVETVDLDELGNFVVRMAQGGFDLSDVENEIRRRAGFPLREEDDVAPMVRKPNVPVPDEEEGINEL